MQVVVLYLKLANARLNQFNFHSIPVQLNKDTIKAFKLARLVQTPTAQFACSKPAVRMSALSAIQALSSIHQSRSAIAVHRIARLVPLLNNAKLAKPTISSIVR